jgi:triphosphatase
VLLGLGAWLTEEPWRSLLDLKAVRVLGRPVHRYAQAALARRHQQVRERGRGYPGLKDAELHRLRIAVKKLRYTAGFFSPLFSKRKSAKMHAALEWLQDALGGINDCVTADRLIEEARRNARGLMVQQGAELLADWKQTSLAARRRQLKAGWKAFRAAGRFWDEKNPQLAARGEAKGQENSKVAAPRRRARGRFQRSK